MSELISGSGFDLLASTASRSATVASLIISKARFLMVVLANAPSSTMDTSYRSAISVTVRTGISPELSYLTPLGAMV